MCVGRMDRVGPRQVNSESLEVKVRRSNRIEGRYVFVKSSSDKVPAFFC